MFVSSTREQANERPMEPSQSRSHLRPANGIDKALGNLGRISRPPYSLVKLQDRRSSQQVSRTKARKHSEARLHRSVQESGGLVTPRQYADAIDRLGLSQRAAGRFLGVDERTSRRWVLGESAIPESAAKLLRLMIRLNIKPEDVK